MACSHGDRSWCGVCDGPMAGENEWGEYPTKYGDVTYLGPLGWEAPNPNRARGQSHLSLWSSFATMPEEYQDKVRNRGAGLDRAQAQRRRAQERRKRARDQALRTQD